MIDYHNEIFTNFATDVRTEHEGVSIVGEYIQRPSEFPTVTIDEIENITVDALVDSSKEEKYSGVRYRVQVFSNAIVGKKVDARSIFATADKSMRGMGFRRIAYTTTPEIYNSTVYSIMATYEAIIDSNGVIYKR